MRLRELGSTPGSRAWLKMAGLALLVFAADYWAICFAKMPILYIALIPALLPLLAVTVVIIPLLNEQKK
jgi:hypothetical protein